MSIPPLQPIRRCACGNLLSGYHRKDVKCTACYRRDRFVEQKHRLCHWCVGYYKEMICPECGTPYDREKSRAAEKRLRMSYFDVVADNAIKAGKDPKKVVRKLRRERGSEFGKGLADSVGKKLDIYLRKKGYVSQFNNRANSKR